MGGGGGGGGGGSIEPHGCVTFVHHSSSLYLIPFLISSPALCKDSDVWSQSIKQHSDIVFHLLL